MTSRLIAQMKPDSSRNGRGGHRRRLAFAHQRSEPPTQPRLGFPSNFAHAPWCGRDLWLFLATDARWIAIGPGGLDKNASRAVITGLGDAAALNLVTR